MDKSDSDTDSSDGFTTTDPLQHIVPDILAQLKHLDLSSHILFKEKHFVGGGGYGDVFKGRCNLPGRGKVKVAIKRLRFYLKEDIKTLFEKEIYVWSKLKHDNVLPLLGYAFANEYRYPLLVSEWMDRGSAWSYVRAHLQCDILRLVTGIARGLAYLHESGVVHSDIKSDNVLVSNSGDALLCDFGCARMMNPTRSLVYISTGIRGTARYLACELLSLSGQPTGHTKASDVWAFGMTVFELLSRKRAYADLSESQAIAAITRHELPSLPPKSEYRASRGSDASEDLWDVCLACWQLGPRDRPDMNSIVKRLSDRHASDVEKRETKLQEKNSSGVISGGQYHAPARVIAPPNFEVSAPNAGSLAIPRHTQTSRPPPGTSYRVYPASYRSVLITSFLNEADQVELPPETKRKGTEWQAIFNPRIERTLEPDLRLVLKREGPVNCTRFSADGRYLATCCRRTIRIHDTTTWKRTCSLYDGNLDPRGTAHIQSLCFSPDGKFLAFEVPGNSIKVWEIATRRIKHMFQGHQQKIHSIEFSKDGTFIVSGSADCTARIWDLDTGIKKILQMKEPPGIRAEITQVSISPDNQLVAAGSTDSVVRIWEVQTGNLVERLKGHLDCVTCVCFSPDGETLFSGSADKTVKQWDVSALVASPGRRLPLPPATKPSRHALGASSIDSQSQARRELPIPPAINPPSGVVIGSNINEELSRERGERGSVNTMTFSGHKTCITSVSMSHDRKWIITVSSDHAIFFIEKSTSTVELMIQGDQSTVLSVDLSSVDGLIVTGCTDKQARIWSYKPLNK